jgi:hypothetical protein
VHFCENLPSTKEFAALKAVALQEEHDGCRCALPPSQNPMIDSRTALTAASANGDVSRDGNLLSVLVETPGSLNPMQAPTIAKSVSGSPARQTFPNRQSTVTDHTGWFRCLEGSLSKIFRPTLTIHVLLILHLSQSTAHSSDTSPPIPSKDQILACIKCFTGLPSDFAIQSTERVSFAEINVPFITALTKDTVGLRVILSPAKFLWRKLPDNPGHTDPSPDRSFTVYTDAEAKRVLGVLSHLSDKAQDKTTKPPLWEPEERSREMGEVYASFPTDAPKITLVEALEALRLHGPAYPPRASEIDGFYVIYHAPGADPIPAWVVDMRGLPPFWTRRSKSGNDKQTGDNSNPPGYSYARSVVNAIDGRWIVGNISTRSK